MDEVLDLKRKLSDMIGDALREYAVYFPLLFHSHCVMLGDAVVPARVNRMYYVNFDDNITAKYGVVIENWPLPKFCAPGDVSSRNELRVLFHSWQSNTTRFRKLTPEEFEKWKANHFNRDCEAPASNVQPNDDASTDPPPLSGPDTSGENAPAPRLPEGPTMPTPSQSALQPVTSGSRGQKRNADFLNVVFSATGEPMSIAKKPRKERKDKGSTRGPRASKSMAAAPAHTTAASSTQASTSTQSPGASLGNNTSPT
jgi:hypothetical protein